MRAFVTHSPEETCALAARLGARLRSGDVILLYGDLGAGKTTFIQGLAKGMGLRDPVTSPTFTLIHEYRAGPVPLFHLDPYRLASAGDVADLGFDEYLEAGGVLAVEWAERLGSLAPDERMAVRLEAGENAHTVTLQPHGARYEALAAGLGERPC